MTCEICGKDKAVIRIRQLIGNESKEIRLCESCAREKGILDAEKTSGEGVSWLLQGLFEGSPAKSSHLKACPNCGLRFREIRSKGQVGCSSCYLTFSREIKKLLNADGGGYAGKLPKRIKSVKLLLIDKENLKLQLQEALENEDYEKAAAVRDTIRKIDNIHEDPQ